MAFSLPCVKKVTVIIQFVQLSRHKQHLHACVPCAHDVCVLCVQLYPKWSLTTTMYLSHTLSTCGPSSPPSSSIPIPLPCPSNGMLPSNPTMSSLPTPCTIESPALSPSQRCGPPLSTVGAWLHSAGTCSFVVLLTRPQSSSIPTTPAAFSSTNSVMTDFLGVKLHGGLPWLIFDVGSGPAVVGSNSTRTFNDGQWHTVSFRTHRSC